MDSHTPTKSAIVKIEQDRNFDDSHSSSFFFLVSSFQCAYLLNNCKFEAFVNEKLNIG